MSDASDQNPYSPPQTEARGRPIGQQFCYITTPAHLRTFWGRCVYIFTGSGHIEIIGDSLTYTYRRGDPVVIPFKSIAGVSTAHFSRIAKPLRMDYFTVAFSVAKEIDSHDLETAKSLQQLCFVPTTGATCPVWKTNRMVAEWAERVRDAAQLPD